MTTTPTLIARDVVTIADEDPDTSYLEGERLEAYQVGAFGYLGVYAVAEIVVAGTVQTISSGGLWGIESDFEASYLAEVAADETAALDEILAGLGVHAPA